MMGIKKLFVVLIILGFFHTLYAQPREYDYEDDRLDDPCDYNPFAVGCRIGGIGPVLGSDLDGNFFGGVGALYGYFILPRVSLAGSASAVFSKRFSQFAAGPDVRLHLGSVLNFVFQAGYGYNFLWVRGAARANGAVYGPSASVLLPTGKNVLFGMTAGYYTFNWGNTRYSEWSYSPAFAIYF